MFKTDVEVEQIIRSVIFSCRLISQNMDIKTACDHDKANEILECMKGSITARDKEV